MFNKNKVLTIFFILIILNCFLVLANTAPIFEGPILGERLDEGTEETIDLSYYFFDPDGDELNYSVSSTENITIEIEDSIATIIPDSNFSGEEIVIFTASDGSEEVSSNEVNIIVRPRKLPGDINNPPELSNVFPVESPVVVETGQSQEFSIEATDADNDSLQITWFLGDNQVHQNSPTYTFSSENKGNYILSVVVSDQIDDVSWSWQISVTDPIVVEKTKQLEAVCGDGIISEGETCVNCPEDVQCAPGWVCDPELETCVPESQLGSIFIYIGLGLIFIFIFGMILTSYLKRRMNKKIDKIKKEEKSVKKDEKSDNKQKSVKKDEEKDSKLKPLSEVKKGEKPKKDQTPELPNVPKDKKPIQQPQQKPQEKPVQQPQGSKLRKSLIQDYYNKMKKAGKSDQDIQSNLLKRGWTKEQINEEWKYLIKQE